MPLKDRALLDYASNGYSPEEIAKATGGSAEEVYARIAELLKSRDVWSEVQQRQLLLHSASKLKEKMEQWMEDEEYDRDKVNSYVKILKQVSDTLDRQSKITDQDIERVTDSYRQVMMTLIEGTYYQVRELLMIQYPDVEIGDVDHTFREALAIEASKVED